MSDDHDWVRRVLAEAGQSPEPMPPDVADRLDRALQEELADSAPGSPPESASAPAGEIVPMTPRRHRRWAGALLAAAAVTVGGYSLAATGLLDDVTGGAAESQSAGDAAGGEMGGEVGGDAPASEPSAGDIPGGARDVDDGATEVDPRLDVGLQRSQGVPALSSDTLRRDAAALLPSSARKAEAPQGSAAAADGPSRLTQQVGCVAPPRGVRGRRISVTYDDVPATAVVRTGTAERTVVQIWGCDTPVRLARVTLPR